MGDIWGLSYLALLAGWASLLDLMDREWLPCPSCFFMSFFASFSVCDGGVPLSLSVCWPCLSLSALLIPSQHFFLFFFGYRLSNRISRTFSARLAKFHLPMPINCAKARGKSSGCTRRLVRYLGLFLSVLSLHLLFISFSVVEFTNYDDMKRAIRKLDDTELKGKRVYLREVKY